MPPMGGAGVAKLKPQQTKFPLDVERRQEKRAGQVLKPWLHRWAAPP